jgi:pheromone shutdown-related protein TraB
MIKAVEMAESKDIKVVLADRDIKVTLKRAMDQMSLKEKSKLLFGLLTGFVEGEEINEELIEKLKQKDVLTELMEELAVETPSIKRVLVDERDEHLAYMIHSTEAKTIVAVVGAGHLEGIKAHLLRMDQAGVVVSYSHSVEGVSIGGISKKKLSIIAYGVPAVFAALILWGFITHGHEIALDMLVKWFLINGSLSALGVALAFGHPATIIAAFIAAPFTSLNPAVAAGWVAGLVELRVRKPRVLDFQNMLNLKTTGDYFRNRVVRVVLIVAFANIGSSVGTFIALPYLASLL